MSTSEAEEAAGSQHYALASEEAFNRSGFRWPAWDRIEPRAQAIWIADAMTIVTAHDAARWRVPTDEEWEAREPVQILWWDRGERFGPVTAILASRRYLTRPGLGRPEPCPIMIADPLPLPELPG